MSGVALSVSRATQREKVPVVTQFPTEVETASVLGVTNKPNSKPFRA